MESIATGESWDRRNSVLTKAVIYERATIVLVAKYVHDVLEVFYASSVHRAS
jgi:hypothetical protein